MDECRVAPGQVERGRGESVNRRHMEETINIVPKKKKKKKNSENLFPIIF